MADEVLDASAVRRWFLLAQGALVEIRADLDAQNVFPVPDRDTGSNLLATWRAGAAALPEPAPGQSPGELLAVAARAALVAARGNSGVILCQLLRGLAQSWARQPEVGASQLAAGLVGAAAAARTAVAQPREGTVLSVAAAAAEAAVQATADGAEALGEVLGEVLAAAGRALARTEAQLPQLAEAGVVDAGGRGLLVLLEALAQVVVGGGALPGLAVPEPLASRFPPRYEVQFLLDAGAEVAAVLRSALTRLGDCVAVVGDDGLLAVHVHTADVGAALECGIQAGHVHRVAVTPLPDAEPSTVPAPAVGAAPTAATGPTRAVVTTAEGDGLAALLAAAGAVVVRELPEGPDGELAATLASAVLELPAREVILLPSRPESTAAARTAAQQVRAEQPWREVIVVPGISAVAGLAAVAVADPSRAFADDVIAMAEAVGATRGALIRIAEAEALTSAGHCRPGDVLGLIGADVVVLGSAGGRDVGQVTAEVCAAVLDRLLASGGELLTLVVGDLPAALVEGLIERVRDDHPLVEVVTYASAQRDSLLMLGLE